MSTLPMFAPVNQYFARTPGNRLGHEDSFLTKYYSDSQNYSNLCLRIELKYSIKNSFHYRIK